MDNNPLAWTILGGILGGIAAILICIGVSHFIAQASSWVPEVWLGLGVILPMAGLCIGTWIGFSQIEKERGGE